MKKTALILGAVAIGASGLYLVSGRVSAYRGDPNVKGPYYSEERHEQMMDAFEKKDYQAWKKLMNGRGRVSQVVNEENFNKFAQMHQLMLDGKTDEAQKIREDLGLGQGRGPGENKGRGFAQGMGRGMSR